MFWFSRRSKIIVDCFTYSEAVYKYSLVERSEKFIPEWYSKMPSKYYEDEFIPRSTMKKCIGLRNMYTTGFMMPLWADLAIKVEDNTYSWQFSDYDTKADIHPSEQWKYYVSPNDFGHMKLNSPWHFVTKEPINMYIAQPFWAHKPINTFTVVPGIMDFYYQHCSNINLYIDIRRESKFIIQQGTPLTHYIPITDKKLELKTHLVDEKEWKKTSSPLITFESKYRAWVNNDNKKSKCPFGGK